MQALLGSTIVTKSNPSESSDVLAGKYVGLYFSAHWCPPCRGFTPKLAEIYNKVIAKGKNFEIVFISSDKSEGQFDEYYAEMPWAALPYSLRKEKEALSKKFKVQGIPTLVILNPDGQVVTMDGRSALSEDPEGDAFPWVPPTLSEMLGNSFIRADGSEENAEFLEGKYVGLYFSAHWCGPCRGFTPTLANTYNTLKGQGTNFEIIFVSSDRSEPQFNEYLQEMPWLALPYANRAAKSQLSSKFGVQGIPTLVILDPDQKVVTKKARGAIGADPSGANFPWIPAPLVNMAQEVDGINDNPALVVLLDDFNGETSDLMSQYKAYAEEVSAGRTAGTTEMLTFFASEEAGPVGQIRKLTKQGKNGKIAVILLDIPDNGGYYVMDGEVTMENIKAFVAAWEGKTLSRQQLG
jgi:nucleoredoxin